MTQDSGTPTGGVCEKCGASPGDVHTWSDDDCVLDHVDHQDRYVGLICRRHYHRIDDALQQILELAAVLTTQPDTGQSDSRPSGAVFSPAPGRLDVMALTDHRNSGVVAEYPHAGDVLGSWVEYVLDGRDIPTPERGIGPTCQPRTDRPGHQQCPHESCRNIRGVWFLTLSQMIGLLRQERHWLAQQPEIGDYIDEINDLHLAMARGARDSMWPRPIGKCPNCSAKLYNTIGVDQVTCRKCRSTWSGIALVRLRLILEQEQEVAG